MFVQCVVFEFNSFRFIPECFLEANNFWLVTDQKVLEFFIIGPGSSAVPPYENWVIFFFLVVIRVYYDGLVCFCFFFVFFFLFLVLFNSSVSILSRRLNLFLLSAVWFVRVDTSSRSRPVDDGTWSILDCGERSCLSQCCSRFRLSNLDELDWIGDLSE